MDLAKNDAKSNPTNTSLFYYFYFLVYELKCE